MKTSHKVNTRLSLTLRALLSALLREKSGQVAVMFAVCSTIILTSVGGGIDLGRAFMQRQVLSNAARLACQYSTRPSIVATAYNGGSGAANYEQNVDNYTKTYLSLQNFSLPQTTAAPFSYVAGGASSVTLSASMKTLFLGIVGMPALTVGVTAACDNGEVQQTNTQPVAAGSLIVSESFETPACSGYCWGAFLPSGVIGIQATPTQTFPTNTGYTGQTGAQWVIMGYCLEIDHAGLTVSTAAQGNYVSELNCDSGTNPDHGLSSISSKAYYAAGAYELRYSFQGRVDYSNYDPVYICGSTANDSAWANDTKSGLGTELRNNQINVYFDPNVNGSPGTHTTLDGSQQLAGTNMIDQCVYSKGWIQRSVKITVTTPGYYWLSFAADGANDSYGGSLDNIMMCVTSCSSTQGALSDNFPSAWPNSQLFEDGFESPAYPSQNPYPYIALNGNISNSVANNAGWPSQTAAGWAVAPYNQVNYFLQGADQGSQYISLDGNGNYSNYGSSCSNSYTVIQGCNDRLISRPFYLDPGYYRVNYDYLSEISFSNNGPYCYAAPASGYIFPGPTGYPAATGNVRFQGQTTKDGSTDILGVFMAHGMLVSTPNLIAPNTANSLGVATTYTNPDGSVTTTPTVAPDAVNWANYNAGAVNPVIDTCGYVYNWQWAPRTTYVEITKPGVYWLTFSANGGLSDGKGPNIDDVRLTALNSLYGAAPSFSVTIPTPGPTPGSAYSASSGIGYTFIADPPTP